MEKNEKKKRYTSGSRSVSCQQQKKSKKSKPNQVSVDLKAQKTNILPTSQQHSSKVKTQNSVNKSKGSKKCTKASKKAKFLKGVKPNNDESKDISRSVSAERKHSLIKMNRTEANFEGQDLQRKIYSLKKTLKKIEKPTSIKSKQIISFYREIQDSIQMVSEPLYSLLLSLHEIYMGPITEVLDMIEPYEHLLQKKQELCREVEAQVRQNEEIYSKLSQEDMYIIKLKQTIEQQRQLIEQKKKQQPKQKSELVSKVSLNNNYTSNHQESTNNLESRDGIFKNEGVIRNMKKDKPNILMGFQHSEIFVEKQKNKDKQVKSTISFKDHSKQEEAERDFPNSHFVNTGNRIKDNTIILKGPSLKLDLGAMNKNEAVGFHDEFYSKIDQFSQSWRNQALRQKRF